MADAEHDYAAEQRIRGAALELYAALQEAAEFIEDQVDVVDGDYGQPKPNRAMSLMQVIEAALRKAAGKS
jgi:hypothetical protein